MREDVVQKRESCEHENVFGILMHQFLDIFLIFIFHYLKKMNKITRTIFLMTAFYASNFCSAQIGINTTTPLSTLDVNGNLSVKEIGIINANVTGSAVLVGGNTNVAKLINDGVYISLTPVATSGNDGPEFILPNPADVPGRIYILRNISFSVDAKLYTFVGQFFAKNSSSATPQPLTMSFDSSLKSVIVVSDGLNWTYFF